MIRILAKFWAKLSYIWALELESGKSELNASLAARNAKDQRTAADLLNQQAEKQNAEADAITANVAVVEKEEAERRAGEEYKKLTQQEQYEDERASKKEKDAALQMANERKTSAEQNKAEAKERIKDAEERERVVEYHHGLAANARVTADKIRSL